MKNIPQKIFLQIGDEAEDCQDFKELFSKGICWHSERVFNNDIEYNLLSGDTDKEQGESVEDIKELPEVAELDAQINNCAHNFYNENFKETQKLFWKAVDAINKSKLKVSAPLEVKDEALKFLKAHEKWEADFISENSMWWPNRENDVLKGKLYEDFLKLQSKRNMLLFLITGKPPIPDLMRDERGGKLADGKKF